MSKLTNDLYKITRTTGKMASTLSDVENIANGRVDKVVKKQAKKQVHKNINKLFKDL